MLRGTNVGHFDAVTQTTPLEMYLYINAAVQMSAERREPTCRLSGVSCATARKMTRQWLVNLHKQTRGCKTYKFCHVRDFTCGPAPADRLP